MSYFRKSIIGFVFIIVTLLVVPFSLSYGETMDGEAEQLPITFENTPQNPEPDSIVKFSVKSYLSDLDSAKISWYVNGEKKAEGTGMRVFSTNVGSIGTETRVRVLINTKEGDMADQIKIFKLGTMDILWETDSYTPPFYQGKALPTTESQIKIVAIPRFGSSASDKNYIFSWKKNDKVDLEQSGYGKNTFTFKMSSLGKPAIISVSASSADKSKNVQKTITIEPNNIKTIVYQYSKTYGTMYNLVARGNMRMISKESNFIAVPYFLPLSSEKTEYVWSMNNNILKNETGSILTLRNDAEVKGNSTISVIVNSGRVKSNASGFSISYSYE